MNRSYYDGMSKPEQNTDKEVTDMFASKAKIDRDHYNAMVDPDEPFGPNPWVAVALVSIAIFLVMMLWGSLAWAQNENFGESTIDRSLSYDNIGRRAGACAIHNRPLYLNSCRQREVDRCLKDNLPDTQTMAEVDVLHAACTSWGDDSKVIDACKREALDKIVNCMGLPPLVDPDYLNEGDK